MNKLQKLLSHLIMILSLVFLVFLILDQFNPLMNFVNHAISHWLLALLCLCGVSESILLWHRQI